MASSPAKTKHIPNFTAWVETEVSVDPDDLRKAGWHHEDECGNDDFPSPTAMTGEDVKALGAAVASLHRQAHPGQSSSVWVCREEPCRSLTFRQIGQVDGA